MMWMELWNALKEIARAPFAEPSALWVFVPLFVIWAIFIIYFDIHKKEKLGWNTALGNGLTLCWITLDLMRHLFLINPADFWMRFFVIMMILLYAIFIMFISFTHKIKDKFVFALSGPTAIYFLAMYAVMWGYGALDVTLWVLIDMFAIFIFVLIVVWILKKILPSANEFDMGDDFKMPEMSESRTPEPSMPDIGAQGNSGPDLGVQGSSMPSNMPPMPKF